MRRLLSLAALAFAASVQAADTPPLFTVQQLTPETALAAAQAALAHCRAAGHQVGVAVVDRAGVLQVLLRDRFAGAHTVDIAPQKAWTAASFRMPTAALAAETQAGRPMSGIRSAPRVMAIGGGQVIEAAGAVVGAIGVSGAPGGEADDACALAGVKAVAEAVELGG
ncbi:GlcG/HbpS family heme-binding protein [Roseateles sp.]|uniref:GlcG/HbpS family heme-binding protein n=1 Tax=Roseateles sp. TaxID=1971397 RepID=UPI0039EC428F